MTHSRYAVLVRTAKALAIPAVLFALLLIFFSHVILGGKILSAADMVFETPFFAAHAPAGFEHASNALLSDQVYQFAPWRTVVWQALQQGHLPLWDAQSLTGRPILATQQSAVFYPLQLLLLPLPFEDSLLWSAILRLWIAGLGMYLLVRHYQRAKAAALIAAIAYMFCGFLVAWLGHPHTNAAVWLPWLILAGDRLLLANMRGKRIQAIALLAVVVAIQFMGGHVQTSLDMLFGFGLYYLLRWWQLGAVWQLPHWLRWMNLLVFPGIALALGVAIAAPQLAPFAEWLPLSEVLGARSAGGFQPRGENLWQQLAPLVLLLLPNFFGNPTWSAAYFTPVAGQNFSEEAMYLGIVPVLLACYALVRLWRQERLVVIWGGIAIISLGRALRLPLFELLNQLPILNVTVSGRMRLVAICALCIMSGFGAHALFGKREPIDRQQRLWVGFLLVCALLCGVAYALAFLGVLWPETPSHLWQRTQFVPLVVLVLAVLLAIARAHVPLRFYQAGMIVLVATDLIMFGRAYNPSVAPHDFYPETPIAAYIRRDPGLFRVSAPHADLIPEAHTMLGLADIRGLDFRTLWYTWYLQAVEGRAGSLLITGFTRLDSPLLRVLNLKYLIAADDRAYAADPTLRFVMRDGAVSLWEVINPQPRAYMVYDMLASSSEQQTIDLLRREPALVATRVILPQAEVPPALTVPPKVVAQNVMVVQYAAESAAWRIQTEADGYLVMSDAYYPGWYADIDGLATPIYRANLAFRAIYVPAGEHTVTFRFQPRLVVLAIAVSLITLMLVFGMYLLPAWFDHKQRIAN
jgi:hypothetical protein